MKKQRIKGSRSGRKSASFKHGLADTTEHIIWMQMNARCYKASNPNYKNWGGRGITVCDRWRTSFINFLEDMGNKPLGKTLDRKDNDGNYTPENCRWATKVEQGRNKRNNRWIEFNGERLTLSEWSERLGIQHTTILRRFKLGWSVEQAFTTPVGVKKES